MHCAKVEYTHVILSKDLRYNVASIYIKYSVKRGNYLAGIYLLAIHRNLRFLVISSFRKIKELFLLSILLSLYFLYLYVISPP